MKDSSELRARNLGQAGHRLGSALRRAASPLEVWVCPKPVEQRFLRVSAGLEMPPPRRLTAARGP